MKDKGGYEFLFLAITNICIIHIKHLLGDAIEIGLGHISFVYEGFHSIINTIIRLSIALDLGVTIVWGWVMEQSSTIC